MRQPRRELKQYTMAKHLIPVDAEMTTIHKNVKGTHSRLEVMVCVNDRRSCFRLVVVEKEGIQWFLLVFCSPVRLVDGRLLRKAVVVGNTLIPSPGLGSRINIIVSVWMQG